MNENLDLNTPIIELLVQRYCTRMRQIRARRKLTQKCIILKYLQYQQASQKLFESYSFKLLELTPPTNLNKFRPPFSIHIRRRRSKPQKRSEYWWKNIFPNLSDNEFYNIFHVHRKFYNELCIKMKPKLQLTPMQNILYESTSVERQIAFSLYKLANGTSYRKTSKKFGIHRTTVHKFFYKFLRELNESYPMDIDKLTEDECHKMNEDLIKKGNVSNAIGVLVRITFGTISPHRIPNTLGVIDVNGRFHFVHLYENTEDEKFYTELDDLCKKHHPENSTNPEQSYLVVTDQIVPDIDCFLNKQNIKFDNEENDELIKNINILLKCEEDGVRKLAERWNTLACNLEFSPNFIPLVIKSCIILHNLCEEFLQREGLEYQQIDSFEFRKEPTCSEDENNDDDDGGGDNDDGSDGSDDDNDVDENIIDIDDQADDDDIGETIAEFITEDGYIEYFNSEDTKLKVYTIEDEDNNVSDVKQEIIDE